jgi:magnesium transporter
MNVNLPGGIGSGSLILGPFTVFIIIIIASAIPAILMFAYFKKLGWISS